MTTNYRENIISITSDDDDDNSIYKNMYTLDRSKPERGSCVC